ncbi:MULTISPECIES: MtrAB system histidine kinase MtrB [Rothia]|uniref:Sensor histidine kinase MtrB n=1 Tax=Rothia dentocariosa TaxID=2047 RepID=A0A509JXF5_9MICC|nr:MULTISPECIES: MtrAB system histidine kinase MtrB [Rothia]EFJ77590.1 ATPase/histidine kinase/DNA gyrase B/HSP90 domain protein [Rothia dentocariosa M567]MBF1649607.1 HAMP domain-containing protein [Rothia dentocariosa]MCM3438531.1 MtrAB system histidine kinase MtrB [Rothia dentocariosa]OFP56907.1 two-component sensor histidine kinase [Rothia sp. HMSC069C01]PAK86607.1 two-component sensor histidine kinase [Rothia dentocariosa]
MPTPDATSGASDSRDLDAKSKPRKKRTLNPFRAIHRLWVHSLQFRSVTSAGIMMLIAFIAVGTSLSNQIATSLFENKKNQALEESIKGFDNVQSVFDGSSEARTDSEIRRNVTRALTLLDASGDTQRRWVLVPLDQQSKKGFIPEQSGDNALDAATIPEDFKSTVRDSPGGVFWEKKDLSEPEKSNGEPYPALIIGTSVSIPQNPDYGLFVVYDLSESSSTITYINVVLGTGFTVLLILVLSIVWFVTRLAVRPITLTAITAEKLAAGDLNRRVSVRGKHQAARLGISFNKMADSLQDQITQLERLSTLQQRFVSDVSHELRTPLSTVRLSSELLYDSRDTLNPVQSRSVELMHNQVDRFQALLSDLLEISRFDAGSAVLNIDAEDFMSVLNDVLVEVIPHLERTGTRLIVHSEQAHIDIDIDRVRIERVLRNLLFNAIEHGESKPVDIYIATNATNLGVAVRDHGIGLSEEEAAQVFNRFWRADTSRKRTLGGTGLGLSITAEDVRLHGGRIEAWGMKGKGACFTMNLPLVHGGELGPSPVLITGEPEPEAYAHSALAGDTLSTSLRKTRHATQDDASEGQV